MVLHFLLLVGLTTWFLVCCARLFMSVPRMAWHMVRRGALRAWSSTSGRYLSSTTPLRDGLTEEQVGSGV